MPRKKKSKSAKRLTDFVPGKLYRNFRGITVWSYHWSYYPCASAQYYQRWSIFFFVEFQVTKDETCLWWFLDDTGQKIEIPGYLLEYLKEARKPIKNPKNT